MKREYSQRGLIYDWEKISRFDSDVPFSIENFMASISYHQTGNIRRDMYMKIRTLFYDLAIEDNLRMGFLKGITLHICNLNMTEESQKVLESKKDALLTKLVKIFMLPQLSFMEFASDNPNLYSRPCADDILDTRLIRGFLDECLPTIEGLYLMFGDVVELERIA